MPAHLIALLLKTLGKILEKWIARNPDSRLAKILGHSFGPRTDTAFMTRGDLLLSGGIYLAFGLFLALFFVGITYLMDRFHLAEGSLHGPLIVGITLISLFMSMIGAAMCIIGGLYLLMRGVIKKKTVYKDAINKEYSPISYGRRTGRYVQGRKNIFE